MKKHINILTILLVVIMTMSSMCLTAFATDDTASIDSDWLEKNITAANDSGVTGTQTWMRGMFTTDPTKSDNTSNTKDKVETSETIKRTPSDKIYIYKEFLNNKQNIYTMIFKDLESLFYQLV